MSAIGTKRTLPGALHMTGFDPKRTFLICGARRRSGARPSADIYKMRLRPVITTAPYRPKSKERSPQRSSPLCPRPWQATR